MQNYYKISEISKLYGIGVDSLRYYEKIGVLNPKRAENNYRLYSLNDLYRLNIIRDLRPLDFSMAQIKDYLDHQSTENTLEVLTEEREKIKGQIQHLLEIDLSLQERAESIQQALAYPVGEFSRKNLPPRPCVQLNANIRRDEETDFAIQRLHKRYENKIFNLGTYPIGATLSREDLNKGEWIFRSVFYILEPEEEYDFLLPKGEYLSFFYTGSYKKSPDHVQRVLAYAEAQGFTTLGDVYEIYHIDNRYTIQPEEFLTEIQVQIK